MWPSLNQNLSLHTKFHQNLMIPGRDIAINHFQNGGRPPSWISRILKIFNIFNFWYVIAQLCSGTGHLTCAWTWLWRYSQNTIFNMAAVRHIGFVVTSSYCIWEHYFTFFTLCQIFKYIGLVVSDILGLPCFIILAWNCYFWGAKFDIFFWYLHP